MGRRITLVGVVVALLAAGLALPGMVSAASAATITVNTSADEMTNDGNCSLREAMQAANLDVSVDHCRAGSGTDTIVFSSGTNGKPIDLTLAALRPVTPMTIKGNGSSKTKITGNEFETGSNVTSTIEDMTLVDVNNENATVNVKNVAATGSMSNNSGAGETSTMRIAGSTVPKPLDNNSGFAGATSTLSITKSSVGSIDNNSGDGSTTHLIVSSSRGHAINTNSGSSVTTAKIEMTTLKGLGKGAGVTLDDPGTKVFVFRSTISGFRQGLAMDLGSAKITDSTFSGNTSSSVKVSDGGLQAFNDTFTNSVNGVTQSSLGTVTLTNTIVALDKSSNCKGAVKSSGGNISDDATCHLTGSNDRNSTNPKLGAVAHNGGPTQTELPRTGSPAIDGGLNSACPRVDQRGVKRPQDGNHDGKAVCDVGAVEVAK